MKKCKVCLENKELYAFDKVSKNGYRSTCRKCRNKKNRSSFLNKDDNFEKMREYQKQYQRNHREKNEYYQVYCAALSDLRTKVRKNTELRFHLENLFTDDMNWNNYGIYWEIDHIISATKLAKIGYSIDEINKLSNLRPLKISENRSRYKETT